MKAMVGGCCVCSDECGWKENPLVYCDGHGCNVAVHQACYGIITVPSGPWYCRKCESQERAARVRCELCPDKDGALKRTDTGGWCHVICALWIPEAHFQNVETMEPINLRAVPHERFNKVCYICEESKKEATKNCVGACMQCNKIGCRQFFHVTCAQSQGLLCEVPGSRGDNVKYIAYCSSHYKKVKKDGNIKTIPAFTPIPNDESEDMEVTEESAEDPSAKQGKKTCHKNIPVTADSALAVRTEPSVTDVAHTSTDGSQGESNPSSSQETIPLTATTAAAAAAKSQEGKVKKRGRPPVKKKKVKDEDSPTNEMSTSPASLAGSGVSGGSVFGGSPIFQSPLALGSFPPSVADVEQVNGAAGFVPPLPPPPPLSPSPSPSTTPPLPPKSVPYHLLAMAQDSEGENGRNPCTIQEFMEREIEDTGQFLVDHCQNAKAADLMREIQTLRSLNMGLEQQIGVLRKQRDSLKITNAKLAVSFASPEPPPHPHTLHAQGVIEVDKVSDGLLPPSHLPVKSETQDSVSHPSPQLVSQGRRCPSGVATSTAQDSHSQFPVRAVTSSPILRMALSKATDKANDKT